jgi:hypothetical protein
VELVCLTAAVPVPIAPWIFSNSDIIDGGSFTVGILLRGLSGCVITTIVQVLRRIFVRGGHKQFDEKPPFMLIRKSWLKGLEG